MVTMLLFDRRDKFWYSVAQYSKDKLQLYIIYSKTEERNMNVLALNAQDTSFQVTDQGSPSKIFREIHLVNMPSYSLVHMKQNHIRLLSMHKYYKIIQI